jgi:outer membrane protein TolC
LRIIIAVCLAMAAPLGAVDWQSPQSVSQAAAEVSPSLLALQSEIAAARERVTTAGSLPNPMLMGGVRDQQVDFSIDRMMTMYMVGASQTLTRKSRRDARRTAAELDVERLERQYDAQRAEIERDVRLSYYDAAAAQNQINATEEIERLTKTAVEAAKIRYETGAVPQSDLVRAMLESSDVRHQLVALRSRRQQAVARLVALLNLPPETQPPAFVLGSEMHHEHDGHEAPATLPDTTPAIAELEAEVQRADQEIRLAKLARRPDIDVEASYGVRPYQKDMFSVVGRIELPYRKSTIIEPRIREAIAMREAALQQIAILRQQLRRDLGVAAALRSEADEQIALHVEQLVPQAKLGFESSLASYQSGKTPFDSVLASLQTYLSLNVDYYDFLRQQRQAQADIEAIRKGARSGASTAMSGRTNGMRSR